MLEEEFPVRLLPWWTKQGLWKPRGSAQIFSESAYTHPSAKNKITLTDVGRETVQKRNQGRHARPKRVQGKSTNVFASAGQCQQDSTLVINTEMLDNLSNDIEAQSQMPFRTWLRHSSEKGVQV